MLERGWFLGRRLSQSRNPCAPDHLPLVVDPFLRRKTVVCGSPGSFNSPQRTRGACSDDHLVQLDLDPLEPILDPAGA